MEGFVMAPLTRAMGWREEEVQVLLAKARQDLGKTTIHSYYKMFVCIVRFFFH